MIYNIVIREIIIYNKERKTINVMRYSIKYINISIYIIL